MYQKAVKKGELGIERWRVTRITTPVNIPVTHMVAPGKRQHRVWGVLTTAVNVNNDSCICNFTVLYTHKVIRGQINSEILLPVI